jgi:carbon storage regulator
MLLIRRHSGQSIRIGEDVEIHIAELSPSRVTIGIRAPREVAVTRSELALTRGQNLAAAHSLSNGGLDRLSGEMRRAR